MRYLLDRVGADHVVFGTDLPFDMAPPDPVGAVRDALGEDLATRVGRTNPTRLFPTRASQARSHRDPAAAEQAMREHLENVRIELFAAVDGDQMRRAKLKRTRAR